MSRKRKVTYTFYVDDTDDQTAIGRKLVARRIRSTAIRRGEKFSEWAKELGVTRAFISQVVSGKQKTGYVRDFIEKRLDAKFWNDAA